MPEHPVFISGIGIVSGVGWNTTEHLDFAGPVTVDIAPDLDEAAQRLNARRMVKYMSSGALLMALAANEALAQVEISGYDPERIGLYAATGLAAGNIEESMAALHASADENGKLDLSRFNREGLAVINPLMSFKVLANMPGCIVSIMHKIKGPNLLFNPFEDQGMNAVFEAHRAIRYGEAEGALLLAGDFPSHPANLTYLRENKLLAPGEVVNSAGVALFLTARPGLALLKNCDVSYTGDGFGDPLAAQFGRTIAAAPLLQLALMARGTDLPGRISAFGQTLTMEVQPCHTA